jgi:hypothetical protein
MKTVEQRKAALLEAKKNRPNLPNETFLEPVNGPAFQLKRTRTEYSKNPYSGGMRRMDGSVIQEKEIPDPTIHISSAPNPHGLRKGVIFYDPQTKKFEKINEVVAAWHHDPELEAIYNKIK